MIEEVLFYNFSNSKYYDSIENAEWNSANNFVEIIKKHSKNDVIIEKDAFYIRCKKTNSKLVGEGWKIHVSANLKNIEDILIKVVCYLDQTNVAFKVVRSRELYRLTSQKAFPREMYGKFITIYPETKRQFSSIIKGLYKFLQGYKGPRVLSDKRYKDCMVLYYRYGGINPICEIDTLGKQKTYIKDGKGNLIEDIRRPYYEPVPFIKEPFKQEKKESSRLFKEYRVTDVLDFKNSGGIYIANRIRDGKECVIKEARPYTALANEYMDAVSMRQREVDVLKRLKETKFVPELIDYYFDSEHFFLIEEYIVGQTLYEYVMFKNAIVRNGESQDVVNYVNNLMSIFSNIVSFLEVVEQNGMIMTDLSLDNIMILEDGSIKVIDLEGCIRNGEDGVVTKHINNIKEKKQECMQIELGKLLFFAFLGKGELLEVSENLFFVFWENLRQEYEFPMVLYELVEKCFKNEYEDLAEIHSCIRSVIRQLSEMPILKVRKKDYSQDNFKETIKSLYRGILFSKNKTMISNYPNVPFLDNENNVSNGSLGIEYALNSVDSALNNLQESMRMNTEKQNSLPGLYTGISGEIWVLCEQGYYNEARELEKNHLREYWRECNDPSMYSGLTGIGITYLKLFIDYKDDIYREQAFEIEEKISQLLVGDEVDSVGYKFGKTGLSLFYLYLYRVSKRKSFLEFGRKLLLGDINRLVYRDDGKIDLPGEEEFKASPYFLEGTAGLLSVLLRYIIETNDKDFIELANKLAQGIMYKQVLSATLFYGMAGIGNTLIDAYKVLGNPIYLEEAYRMANVCSLYKVEIAKHCYLVPDVFNQKLSADFGYGAAGVMLFLDRIMNIEKKNFCFFFE